MLREAIEYQGRIIVTRNVSVFSKLIVKDEEAMAAYYSAVFGLAVIHREAGSSAGTGEAFREVILSPGTSMADGTLVMFKFVDRPPPRDQQAILGFVTEDFDGVIARIVTHGGKLVGPTREMPAFGIRVQFAEDPEGAINEVVEIEAVA